MTEPKVTFANLVSTPTDSSWSQAYTAGKLYAVLSLEQEDSSASHLAAIGKEIINALVEEFFTLETKDLSTIKTAVIKTTEKISKNMHASFVVISLVNNILYAFSYGQGRVALKRHDKVGIILSPKEEEKQTIIAVSGFLETGDMVILQTKQFAETISADDLESFATPAEAVEILSPKIHEKELGGISAIILSYVQDENPTLAIDTKIFQEEEEDIPSALQDEVEHRESPKQSFSLPKFHFSFPKVSLKLPRKTLLLLLIPLILIAILIYSIYSTKKNQENNKLQQKFESVYTSAQKKYDEGQALEPLNKQLAQDDFRAAQEVLQKNKNAFPDGSEQAKKIQELLDKVNALTESQSSGTTLKATEVSGSTSPLLFALLKNKIATYATANDTTIYLGGNTGILSADGKTLIANGGDWKKTGGIGAFGTNIYVLDTAGNQILKYLSGSKDSKSVYASGDFAKSTAMAIDSSIYVLNNDGSIKKFTRGTADAFAITGLETPLKNPTRIFTSVDTDNIYILDPGTARIVVLNKSGAFQTAYNANILKNAKDFDVQEKEKIYVLANNKIYEIGIP